MPNKRRLVDVLSPVLRYREDSNEEEQISFLELLDATKNTTYRYHGGSVDFKLLDVNSSDNDNLSNCKIGILISTQDRDIPPKRDKRTGAINPVDVDPITEGLAYGNVFIYNSTLNILIYEINRNGCYIDKFKDFLYQTARRLSKSVDISYATIARKGAYERLERLTYFKQLSIEIRRPSELIRCFDEEDDSLKNSLVAKSIESSVNSDSEILRIEQLGLTRKKNVAGGGLSPQIIRDTIDAARIIHAYRNNSIAKIEVKGYAEDVEDYRRQRTINLITDVFNEWFLIPDIQIQSDIQENDRIAGIKSVYLKILPELRRILG